MSSFTYETTDRTTPLETYEWDNVWLEHADNRNAKRILYIGDSISCRTRHHATAAMNETVLFDGFGTSKAVDNPYFKPALQLFAAQQGTRRAIIFNNGLHGWHLSDEGEYATYYEDMVTFLMEEFRNTPLYLVLTTTLKDEERAIRVTVRNTVVRAIAAKYNLPLIDLHSASQRAFSLLAADGVHFTEEGYAVLAQEIMNTLPRELFT